MKKVEKHSKIIWFLTSLVGYLKKAVILGLTAYLFQKQELVINAVILLFSVQKLGLRIRQ